MGRRMRSTPAQGVTPLNTLKRLALPLGGALAAQPNLVAHFPPRVELQLAETVPVAIDPGALHFFDEETGVALT